MAGSEDAQRKDRVQARIEAGLMSGIRRSAANYDESVQDIVELAFREFLSGEDRPWPRLGGYRVLLFRNGELQQGRDIEVISPVSQNSPVVMRIPRQPGVYAFKRGKYLIECSINADDLQKGAILFENEAFRVLCTRDKTNPGILEFQIGATDSGDRGISARTLKSTNDEVPVIIDVSLDLDEIVFDIQDSDIHSPAMSLLRRDFPDYASLEPSGETNKLIQPLLLWEETSRLPQFFRNPDGFSESCCRMLQLPDGHQAENRSLPGSLQRLTKHYNSYVRLVDNSQEDGSEVIASSLFQYRAYSVISIDTLFLCKTMHELYNSDYLDQALERILCVSYSGFEAIFLAKQNPTVEQIDIIDALPGWDEPFIHYNMILNGLDDQCGTIGTIESVKDRMESKYDLIVGIPPYLPGLPGHQLFTQFLHQCHALGSEILLGTSSVAEDELIRNCEANNHIKTYDKLRDSASTIGQVPFVPLNPALYPEHPEVDKRIEPSDPEWSYWKEEYDRRAAFFEQLAGITDVAKLNKEDLKEHGIPEREGAQQFRFWHNLQLWRIVIED